MGDFNKQLDEYRWRIANGGLQKLRENLAAGHIALDYKVRAARFAIEEAEAQHTEAQHPVARRGWLSKVAEHPISSGLIVAGIAAAAGMAWNYFAG